MIEEYGREKMIFRLGMQVIQTAILSIQVVNGFFLKCFTNINQLLKAQKTIRGMIFINAVSIVY